MDRIIISNIDQKKETKQKNTIYLLYKFRTILLSFLFTMYYYNMAKEEMDRIIISNIDQKKETKQKNTNIYLD